MTDEDTVQKFGATLSPLTGKREETFSTKGKEEGSRVFTVHTSTCFTGL